MFRLFAVYVAWLVKGLWSVARSLIDEFTATKINIYGSDGFKEDILKIIDEKNLEEKFGGKLPNKRDNFFPPEMLWLKSVKIEVVMIKSCCLIVQI